MRSGSIGTTRSGKYTELPRLQRLAVERGARPDIGGDVGDGDGGDDAADDCSRSVSGCGVDGVVMILGIGRIDGDQRQFTPVLAAGHGRGLRRLGLGDHVGGKICGMPCAWMAIIETAFSLAQRARARCDDLRRAAGRSGSSDAARPRRGRLSSAPLRNSVARNCPSPAGGARPARCGSRRRTACGSTPSTVSARFSNTFITRAGIGGACRPRRRKVFASTRSPTPGAGPPRDLGSSWCNHRRARRNARSHSPGRASRPPSASREKISSTRDVGQAARRG